MSDVNTNGYHEIRELSREFAQNVNRHIGIDLDRNGIPMVAQRVDTGITHAILTTMLLPCVRS